MTKRRLLSSRDFATILIAAFGVIGSITGAYFAFRSTTVPLELSINATQTAEAIKSSFSTDTPIPNMPVNTPKNTPNTIPSPIIIPVQNFSTNCISSKDWTPTTGRVLFTIKDDCWDLSNKGIVAQNGKLFFAIQNLHAAQAGSIYTPIPESGIIKFNVQIDKFVSGETNGNLVFGVGTVDNWLTSGEFIFFRSTGTDSYVIYGTSVVEVGKRTISTYELGSTITLTFNFRNLVFDIYANDVVIASDIPLSTSAPQVFWIGYRLPQNSNLIASVSNFSLEK